MTEKDRKLNLKPNLLNVHNNLMSVIKVRDKGKIPVAELLDANHTLLIWAWAHHITKKIGPENITMVEPFWGLCEAYGLDLSEAEKKKLFEKFIND